MVGISSYLRYIQGMLVNDTWAFSPEEPVEREAVKDLVANAMLRNAWLWSFYQRLWFQRWDLEREQCVTLLNNALTITPVRGRRTRRTARDVGELLDLVRPELGPLTDLVEPAVEALRRHDIDVFNHPPLDILRLRDAVGSSGAASSPRRIAQPRH